MGFAADHVHPVQHHIEIVLQSLDQPFLHQEAIFDDEKILGADDAGGGFLLELLAQPLVERVAELIFASDKRLMRVRVVRRPLHEKAAFAPDDCTNGRPYEPPGSYCGEELILLIHS